MIGLVALVVVAASLLTKLGDRHAAEAGGSVAKR
jgi:hypothetical protein